MKLGDRMMLAVVAVTTTMLALASATILFLVRRDEMQDLDRALLAQARAAAHSASVEHSHLPTKAGSAAVPEHYGPAQAYIAIYGPSGEVLSSTSSFAGSPPRLADFDLEVQRLPNAGTTLNLLVGSEQLRGALIPISGGYAMLYAASRGEVDADVKFLGRVLFVLLVAVIASTTLVAQWVGRRLASDVQQIARVARDVSAGNLAARAGTSVKGSFEARALASDLDHMVAKLEALVLAQRRFISHAAHELMSPLTTLRGELQLARRRHRSTSEHEETLALALSDVDSLVTLAEDLLTLARAENTAPAAQTASVADIVSLALRAAEGSARLRGVALVCPDLPLDAELTVAGVTRELSRALRNLVDNAVAHSKTDDRVHVRVSALEARIEISVQDDGPGVPNADREQIFEPFFRGARERGQTDQGVGLGLSIAREIARRLGGDVVLDSSCASGARFVLQLPRPVEIHA